MEFLKIQNYNNTLMKSIVLLLLCVVYVNAQVTTLPSRQDGFWYKNRIVNTESILIEAFFDPLCPDSRDSWPPLKLALQHYGSRLSLVVHPFPLPYKSVVRCITLHFCKRLFSHLEHVTLHRSHDNNFTNVESVTNAWFRIDCLRHPLGVQLFSISCVNGKFYGNATFNLSRASVVDKIARFTSNSIGNSHYAAVKAGFTDPKTDHATRISFKYGCVKGVYATPFFFVNGFPLPDDGSALDYNAWRKIIHPLLKN